MHHAKNCWRKKCAVIQRVNESMLHGGKKYHTYCTRTLTKKNYLVDKMTKRKICSCNISPTPTSKAQWSTVHYKLDKKNFQKNYHDFGSLKLDGLASVRK